MTSHVTCAGQRRTDVAGQWSADNNVQDQRRSCVHADHQLRFQQHVVTRGGCLHAEQQTAWHPRCRQGTEIIDDVHCVQRTRPEGGRTSRSEMEWGWDGQSVDTMSHEVITRRRTPGCINGPLGRVHCRPRQDHICRSIATHNNARWSVIYRPYVPRYSPHSRHPSRSTPCRALTPHDDRSHSPYETIGQVATLSRCLL